MKKVAWYKSKTLWLAIAQAVVGILTTVIAENPELKGIGALATIKSIIDFYLRYTTNRVIK